MKQAKKTLEGKTISHPCSFKKPDNMGTSMLCIVQQQMCQQEENKATREQQLLMACMEHESSKQACEDQEKCRDCCHQYFMM
eukprot:10448435-Ditylum_brightwellii.AAC.1